jgi:hypothetical protein
MHTDEVEVNRIIERVIGGVFSGAECAWRWVSGKGL